MLFIARKLGDREPEVYHLYPLSERHETNGKECWCEPTREAMDDDGVIYAVVMVHNQLQ